MRVGIPTINRIVVFTKNRISSTSYQRLSQNYNTVMMWGSPQSDMNSDRSYLNENQEDLSKSPIVENSEERGLLKALSGSKAGKRRFLEKRLWVLFFWKIKSISHLLALIPNEIRKASPLFVNCRLEGFKNQVPSSRCPCLRNDSIYLLSFRSFRCLSIAEREISIL